MEVSENLKEVIEFHNNIQKKIYGLDKKWEKLTKVSISKFNEKSVENKIKNFRKEKYLIHDLYPTTNYANLDLNSIKYLLKT